MINKTVSVLLILSLLSWTVGCTSTKFITDLSHYRGKEIEVFTKGGPSYRLTEWASNASGDITGKGIVFLKDRPQHFSGTIPGDTIAGVKGKEDDQLKTAAVFGGVALSVAMIILLIELSKDLKEWEVDWDRGVDWD